MNNKTISAYDKYAHLYDEEVIEFWEEFPRTTLTAFQDRLPGKKVLDLGSGSGRDGLLLRDMGLDVTCLDASIEMVKMTRELGFETQHADFASMDFPTETFDGVWAYTSLIHVTPEEVAAALQKVHSYLQPHGVLAVGVIVGEGDKMVERKSMPDAERYFKYYSPEELQELVGSAGFTLEFSEDYTPHNNTYLTQIFRKV